jgi:hypothetical protein
MESEHIPADDFTPEQKAAYDAMDAAISAYKSTFTEGVFVLDWIVITHTTSMEMESENESSVGFARSLGSRFPTGMGMVQVVADQMRFGGHS